LIDLDPQAHSTVGLGIEPESFTASISDVMTKKKPIREAILPVKTENLFIVPSHIRLDKIEQQLAPELFRETFLKKAIDNVDFDCIVIDCRPTLGTLTINAYTPLISSLCRVRWAAMPWTVLPI
jgi:chromosome partitioning protein